MAIAAPRVSIRVRELSPSGIVTEVRQGAGDTIQMKPIGRDAHQRRAAFA
jgi:hypothetical protein